MGRPINKKYFGNTNYDLVSTPTDDHIGGEGIASINISNTGKYINRLPSISAMPAPSIPTGITAAGVLHSVIDSAVINVKGSGYQIGDVFSDQNGSTWRVTQLRVLTATLSDTPSSQNFDGGEYLVWDNGVNSHWTTKTVLGGVTSSGSPYYDITGWGTFEGGVWDGTDGTPAPTGAMTITGGPTSPNPTNPSYITRGTGDRNGPGGSVDNNGYGGKVTFTYGIETVVPVTSIDYASNGSYIFGLLTTAGAGNNAARITANYKAHHCVLSENGSGYIGTEAIAFTAAGAGEVRATGTIVLEDTQQNAIVGVDLRTSGIVDIVKQESSNSYWVQGTEPLPYLLDLADPSQSVGLYIKATDSSNKDYWVKKLAAHRVTLGVVTGSGEFNEDDTTTWTFDAPVAGVSVTIRNA